MIAALKKIIWGWVLYYAIQDEEFDRQQEIVARYDRGELGEMLPDEAHRDFIYGLYLAGKLARRMDWLGDADEIVRPMSCEPPIDIDAVIRQEGL